MVSTPTNALFHVEGTNRSHQDRNESIVSSNCPNFPMDILLLYSTKTRRPTIGREAQHTLPLESILTICYIHGRTYPFIPAFPRIVFLIGIILMSIECETGEVGALVTPPISLR